MLITDIQILHIHVFTQAKAKPLVVEVIMCNSGMGQRLNHRRYLQSWELIVQTEITVLEELGLGHGAIRMWLLSVVIIFCLISISLHLAIIHFRLSLCKSSMKQKRKEKTFLPTG